MVCVCVCACIRMFVYAYMCGCSCVHTYVNLCNVHARVCISVINKKQKHTGYLNTHKDKMGLEQGVP